MIGLVTFVLPKFVDIFGQFEVELARDHAGRGRDVRRAAASTCLIWVPLLLAAIVGLIVSRNMEAGRRKWDSAMLNTPILRDITRAFYIGRTFRLMGLMIESGVPLLEGLRLTRNSVRNVVVPEAVRRLGRVDSERPRTGELADQRRLRAGRWRRKWCSRPNAPARWAWSPS